VQTNNLIASHLPQYSRETDNSVFNEPDVSVIIVSYNTLDYLRKSLSSIAIGFRRYSTEIIVVDNGSKDGSQEYLSSLNYIRLIANQNNIGFPEANNQAFRLARGKFYYLLNSDAYFHEDCGDIQMDFMLSHSRVGLSVPSFEYLNGSWQQSFGRFPSLWEEFLNLFGKDVLVQIYYRLMHQFKYSLKPRRVDYGEGAGLLIRENVVKEIGGLSPKYFFYGDDLDFGYRASKANWQTWWVPNACLTHVRGGSLKEKNFDKGIESQFFHFMLFWLSNYSLRSVRCGYIMKCFYWQRMICLAQFLVWIPIIGKRMKSRLGKYKIARNIYWRYFHLGKFIELKEKLINR
jgi:GT2 family glycosyltransferase